MITPARLALIFVAAALLVLLHASGLGGEFSLAGVQARQAAVRALAHDHPWLAAVGFVALFGAATGVLIPAALVLTLAGGFLFGPWLGTGLVVAGASLGAAITFLLVRTTAGSWLLRRHGADPRLKGLIAGLRRDAFFYLLSLRLFPLAPFWLVNLSAGLADAPLRAYLAATVLGAIPTSLIYCHLGAGLERVFVSGAPLDTQALLSPSVAWPLAGLALLALAPVAIRRWGRGDA